MNLLDFKRDLDNYLTYFFDAKLKELAVSVADETVSRDVAYLKDFVLAGGKRIRPYVTQLAFLSAGGRATEDTMAIWAASELLHNFCLVHDDIMDKGQLRHDIPTVHRQITSYHRQANRLGDAENLGQSQAILAGDLLLAWSDELFYSHELVLQSPAAILHRNQTLESVILGQMLDVDLTTRPSVSTDLITTKMTLKTASYSFYGPMKLGAALAGQLPSSDGWCHQLGLLLGLAYQIQDDWLDMVATDSELGKPVLSDLQARQPTFYTQYILEHGSAEQQRELGKWFGQPVRAEDQPAIIALFEESGAIAAGRRLIDDYLNWSKQLIEEFPLKSEHRAAWLDLVELIESRQR